jgi:hypothetical protein
VTRTKVVATGTLVFAGLVVAIFAAVAQPEAVYTGRVPTSPVTASGQLITLASQLGENRQQLVVIDPELHVMSVYHIDSAGEITLKSVRNFHWDLQMEHHNGTSPLPGEIRSMIGQR